MMKKMRVTALLSGAFAVALALAGCSMGNMEGMEGIDGNDTSASPSDGAEATFNDADVMFAMNMIVHHEQAIEMADILLDKDGVDERVINLALDIKAAQAPEIETMNGWLEAWGQPTDSTGMEGMEGMDQGGTMSSDDMAALEAASGAEASRLFLEQMTVHHEGAIAMAQDEIDAGENPDAVALAGEIVDAQTLEIATMQEILNTL